jgi:hypothetical protein
MNNGPLQIVILQYVFMGLWLMGSVIVYMDPLYKMGIVINHVNTAISLPQPVSASAIKGGVGPFFQIL